MTEKIEQDEMSYAEASKVLDGAVKRFMADNDITNYSVGFREFRQTPKGEALLAAWDYVRAREAYQTQRANFSRERQGAQMDAAHELDARIKQYASEHGMTYIEAYKAIKSDPEHAELIETYEAR